MKKISFCTTCKGRLWQLKETLPINILQTNEACEIVLLDYHSEDGLQEYIQDHYAEYLNDGRLKYYKLQTEVTGFDMAYAKHIVHTLAQGTVLFNLDADNYIGCTVSELEYLSDNQILLPKHIRGTVTARCGRIGLTQKTYKSLGGYNIAIRGMAGDDGDLTRKACRAKMRFVYSLDRSIPIAQTNLDKLKFTSDLPESLPNEVSVIDINNQTHTLNLI